MSEFRTSRVTQLDIARAASVSQATVSRVLAGDERVDPITRDRVMAAVEMHNYRPDARARSLRNKTTGLIGLAIQRPAHGLEDDPFYTSLISEIADGLAGTEYRLCLQLVATQEQQYEVYEELLRGRSVDGMILVESEANDSRLELLHRDSFPFVLIGNPGGLNVWSVDNDNVHAGQLATRHLMEQGYERIGMIAGRRGLMVSDERVLGYQRALGLSGMPTQVFHSDFGLEAAEATATLALSRPDRPDALVVLDDFMALGVLRAARRYGLSVPDDLGLIGFNDSKLCEMTSPELSSVSLNLRRLVQSAVKRLISVLEDEAPEFPEREIVPCLLKVRTSSSRRGEA